ncbi:unnamed protein product [Fraxinus pennsylvanica]|uniref:Uncharacterized protein n=1 Tax=Fraxinus pennsylvanica TaxID=56036 RepID=A0AAD1ZHC3_9LAMI|nr:unnamed protein product [Fraxinus pennsylvanica]
MYRKDVESTFTNLPASTSDEDVVKLGAVYLISSFMYITTSANVVPHEYFRIVESPHMDTYPWGKELFQITYMYLKLALAKTNPLLDDPKGIMSYRLHGADLVNDPVHMAKDHNHASSSNPTSFMTNRHQVAQDTSKMGEVDVNRIEQSVETNYTALLTMFVRAKKHSPHDKDKHDHIVDQSNEAQTTDNKNSNNQEKSVTPTIDGMVSKKIKQPSQNHSDTPHDDSNPASSKCLTVVINDSIQTDETYDINYTEEDLIQVDGSQTRLSRLHVSDEFGKDVLVQELFPTKNSSLSLSRTCVIDNAMGNLDETMYNMNAFNEEMEPPNDDDVEIFYEWFNDGYRAEHIKSKFPLKKDNISPPFQFGPYTVESKTWWHELCHPNVYLRDSERALYVYNSSRLTVRDRMVVADVEAFAYILPCLMVNIKDRQPNIVDVFERVEPLAVKIASNIPQDEHGSYLAAQLYKHGCEKLIEGYDTDIELAQDVGKTEGDCA